ncbi:MAG: fibronectin type III domain-containing protein, partial [Candidatus Korarchaeota archaeon]
YGDGIYFIMVQASDGMRHGSNITIAIVDNNPPVPTLNVERVDSKVTINWNVSDGNGSGVFRVEIYYSTSPDGPWQLLVVVANASGTYEWDVSSLPAGRYYILINCTDYAGHSSTLYKEVEITQSRVDYFILLIISIPFIVGIAVSLKKRGKGKIVLLTIVKNEEIKNLASKWKAELKKAGFVVYSDRAAIQKAKIGIFIDYTAKHILLVGSKGVNVAPVGSILINAGYRVSRGTSELISKFSWKFGLILEKYTSKQLQKLGEILRT